MALDSRGNEAAAPWIDAADPSYLCLIDRTHRLAELYDIINVPSAVWINEAGRIVRPPESAGMSDGVVKAMIDVIQGGREGASGKLTEASKAALRTARQGYCDAVRDWVENGDASRYALSEEQVLARMRLPTDEHAEATAYFHLGYYLHTQGRVPQAKWALERAVEKRPESISILRQFGDLEEPGSMGGERFFKLMRSRGSRPLYESSDIPTTS